MKSETTAVSTDRRADSDLVASRAERYVARLYSGEMSAREESELFAWLEADQRNRRELDRAIRLWDSMTWMSNENVILAMRLEARNRHRQRMSRRWFAAAAAILVMVAAALLVTNPPGNVITESAPVTYETAIGESRIVSLPDGSTMNMNTASRVIVDYTADARRIILDFGEIYLDVAKDADRPMSVVAGDRVVTALGTKFSVKRVGSDLQIAVEEGTVAVTRQGSLPPVAAGTIGDDDILLQAGAIAEIIDDNEPVATASAAAVERAQGWRHGIVRFDSEPLVEVIGEFNRYSEAKVLIEDSSIMDLQISGALRLDNIELFLSSLEAIHPVRVIRHSDRYVLVAAAESLQ